jgi:hypothetical protein
MIDYGRRGREAVVDPRSPETGDVQIDWPNY